MALPLYRDLKSVESYFNTNNKRHPLFQIDEEEEKPKQSAKTIGKSSKTPLNKPLETRKFKKTNKDDPDKLVILEKSWPMFMNRYMRTFSFCKYCNDRIFAYKNKLSYSEETSSYMIRLPVCKKCVLNNTEITALANERFGTKKKPAEEEDMDSVINRY